MRHEDQAQEDQSLSCWPLTCSSATKISHSALNINKLKPVPLHRHEPKPRKPVGWIAWIFGWSIFENTVVNDNIKKVKEDLEEEEVPDEYFLSKEQINHDFDEVDIEEEVNEPVVVMPTPWYSVDLFSDDELTVPWYYVNLFNTRGRPWYSVTLLSEEFYNEKKNWYDVDLFGNVDDDGFGDNVVEEIEVPWYTINLLGNNEDEINERKWYTIDLLGNEQDGFNIVCTEINNDERFWYEVSFLGNCNSATKNWYDIDLLNPTTDQSANSKKPETRSWFEIDLFSYPQNSEQLEDPDKETYAEDKTSSDNQTEDEDDNSDTSEEDDHQDSMTKPKTEDKDQSPDLSAAPEKGKTNIEVKSAEDKSNVIHPDAKPTGEIVKDPGSSDTKQENKPTNLENLSKKTNSKNTNVEENPTTQQKPEKNTKESKNKANPKPKVTLEKPEKDLLETFLSDSPAVTSKEKVVGSFKDALPETKARIDPEKKLKYGPKVKKEAISKTTETINDSSEINIDSNQNTKTVEPKVKSPLKTSKTINTKDARETKVTSSKVSEEENKPKIESKPKREPPNEVKILPETNKSKLSEKELEKQHSKKPEQAETHDPLKEDVTKNKANKAEGPSIVAGKKNAVVMICEY